MSTKPPVAPLTDEQLRELAARFQHAYFVASRGDKTVMQCWEAVARLSEARPAPDRNLQSALSALRRIEAMSAANHVCTCGRPTGIGGIQSCANRALSERPLLDADDTTSGFDRALSGHST